MRSTFSSVDKYDLKAVIARTALSVVYDGWDGDIARRVAIKLIPLSAVGDEDSREAFARFKRGAQAAGQLNHPNIVSVYDYGETEDYAYLVMEFIDGPTLKTLFDNNRRFTLAEIGSMVGGILDALQYSHDRKVVHRDMKPANVMFTGDNTVKITDFGIARLEDSEMTQAGMVIGTPAYMSPEQFLGEKIDLRTDIYSTGVLLYHILTAERPYEGTLATIMHKVLYGAPLLPSRRSTAVTPALDSVVTRAMARKPEDRFESASQFKSELLKALAIPNARADRTTRPPGAERKPAAKSFDYVFPRKTIIACLAVAAVGLSGAVGWQLLGGPRTSKMPAAQPGRSGDTEAAAPAVLPPASIPPVKVAQPPVIAPVPIEPRQAQGFPGERDANADPRDDVNHQPPLFPPEVRRSEPDRLGLPWSAPVQPSSVFEPSYPPIRNIPEKKSVLGNVGPKSGRNDTGSATVVPDGRAVSPDLRSGKSPAELGNRLNPPVERTPAPGDDAASDALRRLRNGFASRTDPPAELVAPPTIYPTTSSSAIGLLCQSVTADTAGGLGLDGAHGMVVLGVTSGSAAAIAGIQQQDVILKVNGAEINNLSALTKIAANTPAGRPVPVEVFRRGIRQVVQLQVDQVRR